MTARPRGAEGGPDRLLAELHVARLLAAGASGAAPAVTPVVTPADLWAEVRRAPGAPLSLAIAGALRDDPRTAARYCVMLAGAALAHAPVALAASDGGVRRRIGAAELALLPDDDGPPLLVLREAEGARAIEMMGEDGAALRLALPPPEDGAVILALGPDVPEAVAILALLRDPGTALFLLP